jgi:hypothetical protein
MAIDQNQSAKSRTLKRLQVGGLPLIHAIAERMRLKDMCPFTGSTDLIDVLSQLKRNDSKERGHILNNKY